MNIEVAAYELPEIWHEGWFTGEELDRVRALSNLIPGDAQTLLDVGCGNGLFLNWLMRDRPGRFDRLLGVDRSAAALKHVATTKCRVRVDALPFGDAAFDIVTCMEVLEHLPVDTYPRAVDELGRVADRYLLVTVPYRQDLEGSLCRCPSCRARFNPDFHVRSYDEAAMHDLFRQHGFNPVSMGRHGAQVRYLDQVIRSRAKAWWHGVPGMPAYAICPVCGFHDAEGLQHELERRTAAARREQPPTEPLGAIRGLALRIRPRTTAYRWLGTLYERRS